MRSTPIRAKKNYFQETPDLSKSPAVFFNRNFVRKQEKNRVILSITSLTLPQEKNDVFSYRATFHGKMNAFFLCILLKVETRIQRFIFPSVLKLACDLQNQFTSLYCMQKVAPVNP